MKRRMVKSGIGMLLIVVVSFSLLSFSNSKYFEVMKNLEIFATTYREVNENYVDEVNPNTLMRTGIEAMLSSLDPYTNYIPEDDIEDFRTMTTGQYGGIGALVGNVNGKVVITMPNVGFPAYKAGLKVGDELVSVDGVNVQGKNTSDISTLLKGEANSDVVLMVNRFGENEPLEFKITRAKIQVKSVPYFGMVNEKTGYIRLSEFTRQASASVKHALDSVKSLGAEQLILDLRGNPGGLVDQSVNICNLFIPKGSEVVQTRGKVSDLNRNYKTLNRPADLEIPLVVLINSGSASASEIVAGVLQDYDRAVIVGRKSFGKGLVQMPRPLPYNSQLKITTAKYYTPSGRCIQALDYTNRNQDGSVGRVADSLKIEFKTTNGRSVFDGGGVDPEFIVEGVKLAPITINLIRKGLIFDYATEYHYKNTSISGTKNFELSDDEYASFVKWLAGKDYDYKTQVEANIDMLIESAKEEKYYRDIEKQISALRTQLTHNKELDVLKEKQEIKSLLEEQIVATYFLRSGEIEASLQHDDDIAKALEVLSNSELYNTTLAIK